MSITLSQTHTHVIRVVHEYGVWRESCKNRLPSICSATNEYDSRVIGHLICHTKVISIAWKNGRASAAPCASDVAEQADDRLPLRCSLYILVVRDKVSTGIVAVSLA